MVIDNLKPCPFCGGLPAQDIIKDGYYRDRYTIECGNCGLTMWDIARDSLYKTWNTRHEENNEV